jgi:phosphoglycerate dehydrogenase-like enzyme
MTIVISEFMDEEAVREGLKDFHVIYDPQLVDQPEALMRAVADAEALIVRNRTQVRGALLDAAVKLKVIGRLGVGLDNIDVEACKARSIAVYPATGANDVSVAEYVIACALMLLRGAYRATAEVAGGSWRRNKLVRPGDAWPAHWPHRLRRYGPPGGKARPRARHGGLRLRSVRASRRLDHGIRCGHAGGHRRDHRR